MHLIPATLLILSASLVSSQKLESTTVDDSYEYRSDQPDGIQYSSNWQTISSASGFNNTLHLTSTRGSSLVYFFQGNTISYYADTSRPSAQVKIGVGEDQQDLIPANVSTGPQQPLWSKNGLGPGDHQITIRHAGATGRYIGLDYLRIESDHGFAPSDTGPAASSIPQEALIVDSTSPNLTYSGNWTTVSSDTEWVFYGGSMNLAQSPGSTVSFTFTGTAVWYFAATFNRFSGTAKISVDGGDPDVINTFSSNALLQRILWSKTGLTEGEHTVVLEHAGTNVTYANVDFFRYLPSSNSSSPSQHLSTSVGAIVGGVIGGLVLLAIGLFALMLFRRRRQRQAENSNKPEFSGTTATLNTTGTSTEITPFESSTQPRWGYVAASSRASESSTRTPIMMQTRPSKGSGFTSTPPPPRLSYDRSVMAHEGGSESGRTALSSLGMSDGMSDGPPPYIR